MVNQYQDEEYQDSYPPLKKTRRSKRHKCELNHINEKNINTKTMWYSFDVYKK